MEEQIQQYIEQARQAGQHDDEIKRALLDAGWTEISLEPFFQKKQRRMTKGALVTVVTLFSILLVGVGAYAAYSLWLGEDSELTDTLQDDNQNTAVNKIGEAVVNTSVNTLTNNDYSSYTGDAVILQQMTQDDLLSEFQTRPNPIDHQLYDEPELIENVEGDFPDGSYTINYDYHFSSYDPNECVPLIAGIPNPYNTDPYERLDFDGCITDLALISADESVCDLLDTFEYQNRCKNIMAYRLESPVMCFSIIRPDDLTDEAPLAYNFSGSFSQCMYDSIIMGIPSEELCTLLGKTINGDTSWQEECDEELEDYNKRQEAVDNRDTVDGADLDDPYNGDLVFTNLTVANGLKLPKTINGNLSFPVLTTAEGLILPETINGGLWFHSLTSAQGLVLPNIITNDLFLYGLESTEGLVLPKSIDSSINIGIRRLSKEEQSELESKYPELTIQFSL